MKTEFRIVVDFQLKGCYEADVQVLPQATTLDYCIAALRALVDRTSQATGVSPERILGFVEKQTASRDANGKVLVS